MQTRNLTLRLDEDTVRLAKAAAARKGTSVSKLVAGIIRELATKDSEYERARRRVFEIMDRGLPLGGGPYWKDRDELYDRPGLRRFEHPDLRER